MHVVLQNASITLASARDVHKLTIYPKAMDGRGILHLFDSNGKVLETVILDTIDSISIANELSLSIEQLALIPAPINQSQGD